MTQTNHQKLAIFYEHPEWFKPMFAELDRRGVPYDRLLAYEHHFDPTWRHSPYALVVNRMSSSAYLRGHAQAVAYTVQYLAYLKAIGANVLNGYDAYIYEFSKAQQLTLLQKLGLRTPKTRVINHVSQIGAAGEGLTFPVVIKPNTGGSGAGIQKFDTLSALAEATTAGTVDLGPTHLAQVQEYLPPLGNSMVRVETLNGKFLYAIRLHIKSTDTFNLCPADYCRLPQADQADDVSNQDLLVEGYTPPKEIIKAAEQIMAAAHIEVGGVEYLVNDRDGEIYYYDINALSNFVADAPNVIGFDPFPHLVDFFLERAGFVVT